MADPAPKKHIIKAPSLSSPKACDPYFPQGSWFPPKFHFEMAMLQAQARTKHSQGFRAPRPLLVLSLNSQMGQVRLRGVPSLWKHN